MLSCLGIYCVVFKCYVLFNLGFNFQALIRLINVGICAQVGRRDRMKSLSAGRL